MANRVLMDLSGVQVSKAGINVLTAANADLLFSSEWTHLREVVSGVVRVTYGAAKITVPFGVTFGGPPFTNLWYLNGGDWLPYWLAPDAASHGAGYMVYVTASNIQFLWNSQPSTVTYYDVAYRVWGYTAP